MGIVILTAHSTIGREVTQGRDTALSVHCDFGTQMTHFYLFTVIQDPIRNFLIKLKGEIRQALCWADPLE